MAQVSRRKQLYMYHLGKCNECDRAAKRLCDKGLTLWNGLEGRAGHRAGAEQTPVGPTKAARAVTLRPSSPLWQPSYTAVLGSGPCSRRSASQTWKQET